MQKKQTKFAHTHTRYTDFFNGAAVLYALLDKNINTDLNSSSFLVCVQLKDQNSL